MSIDSTQLFHTLAAYLLYDKIEIATGYVGNRFKFYFSVAIRVPMCRKMYLLMDTNCDQAYYVVSANDAQVRLDRLQ